MSTRTGTRIRTRTRARAVTRYKFPVETYPVEFPLSTSTSTGTCFQIRVVRAGLGLSYLHCIILAQPIVVSHRAFVLLLRPPLRLPRQQAWLTKEVQWGCP